MILGDVFPDVLFALFGEQEDQFMRILFSRRFILSILSLLVLLPISMNRSLNGLAFFSIFALAAIAFIIVVLLATGPSLPAEFAGTPGTFSIINLGGVSRAIGIFSFGMCTLFLMHP